MKFKLDFGKQKNKIKTLLIGDLWVSCYIAAFRIVGSHSLLVSFISEDMFPFIMKLRIISSHLCLASSISCLFSYLVLAPMFPNYLEFWNVSSKTLLLTCFRSYLPKLSKILEAIFRNQVAF
jgi:hypothetical protein